MSPRKSTSEVMEILAARGLRIAEGCEYLGMHAPLTVIDALGRLRTTPRAQAFVGQGRPLPKTTILRPPITVAKAETAAESRGWRLEVKEPWRGGRTILSLHCPGGIHHTEPHTWQSNARKLMDGSTFCEVCLNVLKPPRVRIKAIGPQGQVFEPLLRAGLAWLLGDPFVAARPRFLRSSTGALLSLDAWCPTLRIAAEYQGRQHYSWVPFFHSTEEAFLRAQACDSEKATILEGLGIPLILVPYYQVTIETMDAFLRQEITRLGITAPLNPAPIPINDPVQLGLDWDTLDDTRLRQAASIKGLEVLVYRGMRAPAVLQCGKGHITKTYPANLISRTKEVTQEDGTVLRVLDPVGYNECRRVMPEDILYAAMTVGLEVTEDLPSRDLRKHPLGRSDSKVRVRCPLCDRTWSVRTQNLLHGSACKCRTRRAGNFRSRVRLMEPNNAESSPRGTTSTSLSNHPKISTK